MVAKTVFKGYRLLEVFGSVAVAVALLLLPAHARADENNPTPKKTGVYVTPKLNLGVMTWKARGNADAAHNNQDGEITGTDSFGFNSSNANGVLGGALALGYDFHRTFAVPMRVELEYGIYSGASGSVDSHVDTSKLLNGVKGSAAVDASTNFDIEIGNIQTLMANLYWDFHNDSAFTPYIGAGIGMAFIQTKGSVFVNSTLAGAPAGNFSTGTNLGSKTNTNFAWQVGAGCSYDITETVALDLGYRFMGLGTAKTKWADFSGKNPWSVVDFHAQGKAKNIYMHQISMGLRISF